MANEMQSRACMLVYVIKTLTGSVVVSITHHFWSGPVHFIAYINTLTFDFFLTMALVARNYQRDLAVAAGAGAIANVAGQEAVRFVARTAGDAVRAVWKRGAEYFDERSQRIVEEAQGRAHKRRQAQQPKFMPARSYGRGSYLKRKSRVSRSRSIRKYGRRSRLSARNRSGRSRRLFRRGAKRYRRGSRRGGFLSSPSGWSKPVTRRILSGFTVTANVGVQGNHAEISHDANFVGQTLLTALAYTPMVYGVGTATPVNGEPTIAASPEWYSWSITSQAPAAQELQIVAFVCRRDCSSTRTPAALANEHFAAAGDIHVPTSGPAWTHNDQSTSNFKLDWWNNPLTKKFWTKIHHKTFFMNHGQVVNHGFKFIPTRRVYNKESTTDLGATIVYYRGLTHVVYFVANGSPVHDTTTHSLVSSSACKFDVTETHLYGFQTKFMPYAQRAVFDQLPTVAAAQVMNQFGTAADVSAAP